MTFFDGLVHSLFELPTNEGKNMHPGDDSEISGGRTAAEVSVLHSESASSFTKELFVWEP